MALWLYVRHRRRSYAGFEDDGASFRVRRERYLELQANRERGFRGWLRRQPAGFRRLVIADLVILALLGLTVLIFVFLVIGRLAST
jgi:hypothetical protein